MDKTRVAIGMSLVVDADSYAQVGKLMDAIQGVVKASLHDEGIERGAFDFTHFNTQPCKASQMTRYEDLMPMETTADFVQLNPLPRISERVGTSEP